MAYFINTGSQTYLSSAAVPQFRFVTVASGTGKATTTGAGAAADAVSMTATSATDQVFTGQVDGLAQVESSATIAIGANIASTANGRAVTAATGNVILGKAREAAVAGQIMVVEINRAGTVSP